MVLEAVVKNTREIKMANKASGTATANGEIIQLTAGLAVPATSATTTDTLLGLSKQTITVAEALTQVPYLVTNKKDTYVFATTNNTSTTHNGQNMVLTDSTTVNNTGTTNANGIVRQVDVYGVTTDKKIIGSFLG